MASCAAGLNSVCSMQIESSSMPLQPKFMQKDEKGRTLWLLQISNYQHSHAIKVTTFHALLIA